MYHSLESCAGLCNRVVNVQGLSHYLEHMLFMGSKKYPDENEYNSYLTKHGGSSNAFTELVRVAITFLCITKYRLRRLASYAANTGTVTLE